MCGRYGLPGDHPVMLNAFDIKTNLRSDIDLVGTHAAI